MTTSDAIAKFGSNGALARALGCSPAAISQWDKYPPRLRQFQIESITRGELRAEPIGEKVAA